jgi:hypothetical protein
MGAHVGYLTPRRGRGLELWPGLGNIELAVFRKSAVRYGNEIAADDLCGDLCLVSFPDVHAKEWLVAFMTHCVKKLIQTHSFAR